MLCMGRLSLFLLCICKWTQNADLFVGLCDWTSVLLQVEGKHDNFRCFYLSENLDVNDDYTFWIHRDDQESLSELTPALTGAYQFPWSKMNCYYCDTQLVPMLSENDVLSFSQALPLDKIMCISSPCYTLAFIFDNYTPISGGSWIIRFL